MSMLRTIRRTNAEWVRDLRADGATWKEIAQFLCISEWAARECYRPTPLVTENDPALRRLLDDDLDWEYIRCHI